MHEALAPFESQAVEQYGQHFKVIVLLVSYDVYHFLNGEVLVSQFGGAYVLCHIHRCAVGTYEQFFVEPFVAQVGPNTAVVLAEENAFVKPVLHKGFAYEIGIALIIYLVEAHAHRAIGFVKAGVHPFVHFPPQCAHFIVALFPFHEHFVCFAHERCVLFGLFAGFFLVHALGGVFFGKFLYLLAVVLVEQHVIVANQVVAFLARRLRCLSVAVFEPREHGLADMYAAVVHDVGLDNLFSAGFLYVCQRPAEQNVAQVTQVQWLVGVGR